MGSRYLMPGHFVDFGVQSGYGHSVGGEHSIKGAWCPNCDKPLMLHMTLDASDPALKLNRLGLSTIPLLYCSRCSLSWYDFTYVLKSETEIKLVEFFTGETNWDEWNSAVGVDVFPKQSCSFRPMPSKLQKLYDKLNDDEELSERETRYVLKMTDVIGNIIDVTNQVGGRSFLCQMLLDPWCVNCQKVGERNQAFFLASLTNVPKAGVVFSYDSIQIVFFFCPVCRSIKVTHSC